MVKCVICGQKIDRKDLTSECCCCRRIIHSFCFVAPSVDAPAPCCANVGKPTVVCAFSEATPPFKPATAKRLLSPPSPASQPTAKTSRTVTPPLASDSSKGISMAAEPPAWFTASMAGFRNSIDALSSSMNRRFDELNESNRALSSSIDELRSQFSSILDQVDSLANKVEKASASIEASIELSKLVDSCEILISGVPSSSDLPDSDIVSTIFKAIEAPNLYNSVIEVRKWTPRNRNLATDTSASISASASSPIASSRAIVVKLSSSVVRDLIIQRSSRLQAFTCFSLFKTGGNHKIYLRPLWPKPVHDLWRIAANKSKELNYARPIVRNLCVFMRETISSTLIPIFGIADIERLNKRVLPSTS